MKLATAARRRATYRPGGKGGRGRTQEDEESADRGAVIMAVIMAGVSHHSTRT